MRCRKWELRWSNSEMRRLDAINAASGFTAGDYRVARRTTAAMPTATAAMARPRSIPLTAGEAGRGGGEGLEAGGGGAAAALGAVWALAEAIAEPGAAGGGAGIAMVCLAAGAPAAGILMAGPPVGLGGKLMRTVCFFWASAAFAGSPPPGAGGTGGTGVISDIKL